MRGAHSSALLSSTQSVHNPYRFEKHFLPHSATIQQIPKNRQTQPEFAVKENETRIGLEIQAMHPNNVANIMRKQGRLDNYSGSVLPLCELPEFPGLFGTRLMSESCLTDLSPFGILDSLLTDRNSRIADRPRRFGNLFEIDFEGVARMPSPEFKSAPKLFGLVIAATIVWLMTTAPAAAAFWFPLPVQPNPGNVPLPPNQLAPNNGGSIPIDVPNVPPPDVAPNANSPEPASAVLGLVGLGTAGLIGFWRRQRRRMRSASSR
jgi:hypothetical protein